MDANPSQLDREVAHLASRAILARFVGSQSVQAHRLGHSDRQRQQDLMAMAGVAICEETERVSSSAGEKSRDRGLLRRRPMRMMQAMDSREWSNRKLDNDNDTCEDYWP